MAAASRICCWRVALVAAAGFALTGCSAMQKDKAKQNPLTWLQGEKQEPVADLPPNVPSYTVEIRREGYTSQFVRIPHQGITHLQDALEKSGATQKIKRMELYVLRTPPNGGPRQRMTAVYDAGQRRVAWESDYAIYPGDHIVVTEDTSSEFDQMVSRFLGPLAGRK